MDVEDWRMPARSRRTEPAGLSASALGQKDRNIQLAPSMPADLEAAGLCVKWFVQEEGHPNGEPETTE